MELSEQHAGLVYYNPAHRQSTLIRVARYRISNAGWAIVGFFEDFRPLLEVKLRAFVYMVQTTSRMVLSSNHIMRRLAASALALLLLPVLIALPAGDAANVAALQAADAVTSTVANTGLYVAISADPVLISGLVISDVSGLAESDAAAMRYAPYITSAQGVDRSFDVQPTDNAENEFVGDERLTVPDSYGAAVQQAVLLYSAPMTDAAGAGSTASSQTPASSGTSYSIRSLSGAGADGSASGGSTLSGNAPTIGYIAETYSGNSAGDRANDGATDAITGITSDDTNGTTNGITGNGTIGSANDMATDATTDVTEDDTTPAVQLSTGTFIWPAEGNLTSKFGRRSTTVGSTNHKGIDVAGPSGTPIYAADGGVVIVSERSSSFGNLVQIQHDNGYITLYAHCSKLLVRVGDVVSQGQQIALMGRTGVASGVHLHFELIIDGKNVNPLPHLPERED